MTQAKRGQVGVTCHLLNPTLEEVAELARRARPRVPTGSVCPTPSGGATRGSWSARRSRRPKRIPVGPMVTNPFLRHPFHTAAAVATLQDRYGDRVLVGIAAGGSEVSGAAGVDRGDAAERIEELVTLLRRVGDGGPLDEASGRSLEVPMRPVPITIAGRGNKILRVGGRMADHVLLWAIPDSDLDRIVGVVRSGGDAPLDVGAARRRRPRGPRASSGDRGLRRAQRVEGAARRRGASTTSTSPPCAPLSCAEGRRAQCRSCPTTCSTTSSCPTRTRRRWQRAPSRSARPTWPSPRSRSTPSHDRVAWARAVLAS